MELAEVLGLVDEAVARIPPELVARERSQETYLDLEAIYDRVFDDYGVTDLVNEVLSRVLMKGDDAVAYANWLRDNE
jgi:hypothetical protein